MPTVAFGKDIIRGNPDANLDVSIVIPAAISERPEGMEGNIDKTQEGIPDSQELAVPITETDITGLAQNASEDDTVAETRTAPDTPSAAEQEPEPETNGENSLYSAG